ncbi:hypothetical protein Q672_06780 [Marinobacter sp. EVN1]|jgi:uncharacterized protein DUF6789|uniref:DUF6789 family protein n=1 Tax=Marinobacter sp. EVN1 TaxID=1397532 RepID=UPI0003B84B01|nr:DUF6789 family protein [Marinobacter sp. EVN1]ERS81011.1 hypothetical protein Q672_06780 [Marinobacter sp. EVN1]
MRKVLNGMIGGLVATIVLSLIMAMKSQMGVMPDLNVIKMLASQMESGLAMGWAAHFMIGVVVYGVGMAVISNIMPGKSSLVGGIILGIAGWLIMMVMLMPMMGAGFFAMAMGPMAMVATLVLHLIFGSVLGLVYGKLPT